MFCLDHVAVSKPSDAPRTLAHLEANGLLNSGILFSNIKHGLRFPDLEDRAVLPTFYWDTCRWPR